MPALPLKVNELRKSTLIQYVHENIDSPVGCVSRIHNGRRVGEKYIGDDESNQILILIKGSPKPSKVTAGIFKWVERLL